jgi:hypothetical protein
MAGVFRVPFVRAARCANENAKAAVGLEQE